MVLHFSQAYQLFGNCVVPWEVGNQKSKYTKDTVIKLLCLFSLGLFI